MQAIYSYLITERNGMDYDFDSGSNSNFPLMKTYLDSKYATLKNKK